MIGFSCIIRVLYVAFTCIEVDGAVDTDVGYQAEAFVDTDVVAYFYGDVQVGHLYFRIGEVRHAGIEQLHTASGLHPGKSRHQYPMVLELIVHGSAQLPPASTPNLTCWAEACIQQKTPPKIKVMIAFIDYVNR